MSQDYTIDCFASGHVGQTDLANMEKNFACLRSSFSGSGTPANTEAGMLWYDTGQSLLKHRNAGDSAFRGILAGSSSLKMWLYLNTAEEGWVIDSGVTDKVLSLKGGSQAYNTGGGSNAGTWTQPNHTHGNGSLAGPSHAHSTPNHSHPQNITAEKHHSGGEEKVATSAFGANFKDSAGAHPDGVARCLKTGVSSSGASSTGSGGTGAVTGSTAGGATAATYRPSAAVGTLQYPDV